MKLKYYTITNDQSNLADGLEASLKGRELVRKTWSKSNPVGFTDNTNAIILEHMAKFSDCAPVICNDDIEFEDIDEFEKRTEKAIEEYGIILPMQSDFSNPNKIIMAGVGAAYPSGQHQTGIRSNEIRDEYQRFNWLPFASEVLNPQMIREVGLLDKNLVLWFSDSDYCMRANWVGWKVMMDRGSVVRHHNHATLGNPNKELFLRDYIAFQQKWGGLVLKGVS